MRCNLINGCAVRNPNVGRTCRLWANQISWRDSSRHQCVLTLILTATVLYPALLMWSLVKTYSTAYMQTESNQVRPVRAGTSSEGREREERTIHPAATWEDHPAATTSWCSPPSAIHLEEPSRAGSSSAILGGELADAYHYPPPRAFLRRPSAGRERSTTSSCSSLGRHYDYPADSCRS